MGGGCPLPLGGKGSTPGNFENLNNSIWGTLMKSRGSFMQKLKRKNCTCVQAFCYLPSTDIGIIYHIILFLNMNANKNIFCCLRAKNALISPWSVLGFFYVDLSLHMLIPSMDRS